MENCEKLIIPYPIVVEGKYDRLRLLSLIEGRIYTTDGFSVFNKSETLSILRALSERSPIIVLTDSDGAGTLIRSHITSAIPKERLIQLYTPQIKGKEKRKAEPSKAGFLGVEGMEASLLRELFAPYSIENLKDGKDAFMLSRENPLSKKDFYIDGLSGGTDSAKMRDSLAKSLDLPCGMTANALLSALKLLISYEEYLKLVGRES